MQQFRSFLTRSNKYLFVVLPWRFDSSLYQICCVGSIAERASAKAARSRGGYFFRARNDGLEPRNAELPFAESDELRAELGDAVRAALTSAR